MDIIEIRQIINEVFFKSNPINDIHKNLLKTHVQKTPRAETQAVTDYTADNNDDKLTGSRVINHALLGKSKMSPEINKRVDLINNHIGAQTPLSKPLSVYSSTGSTNLTSKNSNNVMHSPAFISSSIDPHMAFKRASSGDNVMHFKLPAGYNRGAYVHPHSIYDQEKEFILGNNQKFKHVSSEVNSDGINVHTLEPVSESVTK